MFNFEVPTSLMMCYVRVRKMTQGVPIPNLMQALIHTFYI